MNNPQVHITLLHKNTPLYDINMSKNNILPVLQRCMLESSLRLWHLFLLQHFPKSSISHCEQSEWMCLYSSETDSDMGRGLPYKLLHQRLNLYGKHNLHFKMKSNSCHKCTDQQSYWQISSNCLKSLTLTSGWSGATPKRTSPNGTGNFS